MQIGTFYWIACFAVCLAVGRAQERRTVRVAERRQTVRLDLPGRPSSLVLDPDGWLLHAAAVSGP